MLPLMLKAYFHRSIDLPGSCMDLNCVHEHIQNTIRKIAAFGNTAEIVFFSLDGLL